MRLPTLAPLVLLLGCAPSGPGEVGVRQILTPCHVQGLDAESLCGTVTVFEDRAAQQGRTIDLNILVVPAVSPSPRPDPVFVLAGGPGQAATEVASATLPAFQKVQKRRDLVFVDQRGTGKSGGLRCPAEEGLALAAQLALDPVAEAARCRAALSAQADLTKYDTATAMDDLDQVRSALGYTQINLYGVSYGTRAGLVYMRRHPASVRTAILDGVAPLQMPVGLYFAQDGQAALDALSADCAAEAGGCAEAFPALPETFAQVQASLEPPRAVVVEHPRTGAPETLTLDRDTLGAGVQALLYMPLISSLLPLTLSAAAEGNFDPFITQAFGFSEGVGQGISDGMRLSVMCAEDVPRYPEDLAPYGEGTALGSGMAASLRDTCADWPRAAIPPAFWEPVTSDVPTLLLSGALDPVTPPRWAALAAETLPRARHLIAPGAGHNVAPYGCMPRLIEEFLDAGDAAGLDVSCVERIQRPPFFIDFAGPAQ